MESNPEEFFDDAYKWGFMFSANFRDVLTEPEKGALHEALKAVKRKEFDDKVMRRLMQEDIDSQLKDVLTMASAYKGLGRAQPQIIGSGGFGQAQVKSEGTAIGYDFAQQQEAHNRTNFFK
jgi:hypothetical protein